MCKICRESDLVIRICHCVLKKVLENNDYHLEVRATTRKIVYLCHNHNSPSDFREDWVATQQLKIYFEKVQQFVIG